MTCCSGKCASCKTSECTKEDVERGCCATSIPAEKKCIYNTAPCQLEPMRQTETVGSSCWLRISKLGQVPADGSTRIYTGQGGSQNDCVKRCGNTDKCTTVHYVTGSGGSSSQCMLYSGSKGGQDADGPTPSAVEFDADMFEAIHGVAFIKSQCKGCCLWTGENFSGEQHCYTRNVDYFGTRLNNLNNSVHSAGNCRGEMWTKKKYGGEGGNYVTFWPGMAYKRMSPPWKEELSSVSCSCN
eukprot:GDKI01035700.1.p1 GENE.GDKI01035700.1~~GDKI01035700.1.p1  ORF type:complete len:241 (-),score=76.68 GDKI01035700.1:110-832(-)